MEIDPEGLLEEDDTSGLMKEEDDDEDDEDEDRSLDPEQTERLNRILVDNRQSNAVAFISIKIYYTREIRQLAGSNLATRVSLAFYRFDCY